MKRRIPHSYCSQRDLHQGPSIAKQSLPQRPKMLTGPLAGVRILTC